MLEEGRSPFSILISVALEEETGMSAHPTTIFLKSGRLGISLISQERKLNRSLSREGGMQSCHLQPSRRLLRWEQNCLIPMGARAFNPDIPTGQGSLVSEHAMPYL